MVAGNSEAIEDLLHDNDRRPEVSVGAERIGWLAVRKVIPDDTLRREFVRWHSKRHRIANCPLDIRGWNLGRAEPEWRLGLPPARVRYAIAIRVHRVRIAVERDKV